MPLSTTYRVEHGQLIGARQIASPNYNQRPES
ncbi:1,6-anhydro-N-acetylmuramyl-L-alanine amidase AmpD, partial [Salmonella enterica subsp. enterica]|nr:1,6-anhydro-N-acetylmuramyl-L-alanine amidase AmpD [Salmonella enterica subsp. enterica serovar Paratyphi A]